MRGQVGIEYLFLVALLLAALIPITAYTLGRSYESITISQARQAVEKIGLEAENLYQAGGGKQSYFITFPEGIQSTFVGNRTVMIRLGFSGVEGDFSYTTDAPVNGTLPSSSGGHQITLEFLDGVVQVT